MASRAFERATGARDSPEYSALVRLVNEGGAVSLVCLEECEEDMLNLMEDLQRVRLPASRIDAASAPKVCEHQGKTVVVTAHSQVPLVHYRDVVGALNLVLQEENINNLQIQKLKAQMELREKERVDRELRQFQDQLQLKF